MPSRAGSEDSVSSSGTVREKVVRVDNKKERDDDSDTESVRTTAGAVGQDLQEMLGEQQLHTFTMNLTLLFPVKNAEGQTAVALKYIEFDNIAEAVAGILGHVRKLQSADVFQNREACVSALSSFLRGMFKDMPEVFKRNGQSFQETLQTEGLSVDVDYFPSLIEAYLKDIESSGYLKIENGRFSIQVPSEITMPFLW